VSLLCTAWVCLEGGEPVGVRRAARRGPAVVGEGSPPVRQPATEALKRMSARRTSISMAGQKMSPPPSSSLARQRSPVHSALASQRALYELESAAGRRPHCHTAPGAAHWPVAAALGVRRRCGWLTRGLRCICPLAAPPGDALSGSAARRPRRGALGPRDASDISRTAARAGHAPADRWRGHGALPRGAVPRHAAVGWAATGELTKRCTGRARYGVPVRRWRDHLRTSIVTLAELALAGEAGVGSPQAPRGVPD